MNTPDELVIDMEKASRSLAFTPELAAALPSLPAAFEEANNSYAEDRAKYLGAMAASLHWFKSSQSGKPINYALIYNGQTAKSKRLTVCLSPFSDEAPVSSADIQLGYVQNKTPSFKDIQKAQPNSWSQLTKAAIFHDVLDDLGEGAPVLTIFRPIKTRTYDYQDRKAIRHGDYSPVGRIVEEAIGHAQDELHGKKSETQIDEINLHGMSLGASEAVGAAGSGRLNVASVTAQELILGPKNILDLARRFMVSQIVGEESDTRVDAYLKISEPVLRREIDAHGNELAMFTRLIRAIGKITLLNGLTNPKEIVKDVEVLLDRGVPVTVALAENSSLTHQTADFLPGGEDLLSLIKIRAVAGQKIGHIADEHVALDTTVLALGIKSNQ